MLPAKKAPLRFGPYEGVERIGFGGMAMVFKARLTGPNGFEKVVVVKAILPSLAPKKEFLDMFANEARLTAQLQHPHIVQVQDFGIEDGAPYLVMEYLPGRNLAQLFKTLNGRAMPVGASVTVMRDVCQALGYAHEFVDAEGGRHQIIHRDVSPANVMLCTDGAVKLLDFGVAKITDEFSAEVTRTFRGKYAYTAPEQIRGLPIDCRIDVFAAGVILHEMLTGERLFAAKSELETLERVAAAAVDPPSKTNPEVPPELDAIVLKALKREPFERFRNGAEMAEALDSLSHLVMSRRQLRLFIESLPLDATAKCECGAALTQG